MQDTTKYTFGQGHQYFQLEKGGDIYKTVRVSSGPGTGHLYAKSMVTGRTRQIPAEQEVLPVEL